MKKSEISTIKTFGHWRCKLLRFQSPHRKVLGSIPRWISFLCAVFVAKHRSDQVNKKVCLPERLTESFPINIWMLFNIHYGNHGREETAGHRSSTLCVCSMPRKRERKKRIRSCWAAYCTAMDCGRFYSELNGWSSFFTVFAWFPVLGLKVQHNSTKEIFFVCNWGQSGGSEPRIWMSWLMSWVQSPGRHEGFLFRNVLPRVHQAPVGVVGSIDRVRCAYCLLLSYIYCGLLLR